MARKLQLEKLIQTMNSKKAMKAPARTRARNAERRLFDRIFMVCNMAYHHPRCRWEEECTSEGNRISFTEYYCPRCGHGVHVEVRMLPADE